jgi:hypothetical protein
LQVPIIIRRQGISIKSSIPANYHYVYIFWLLIFRNDHINIMELVNTGNWYSLFFTFQ